MTRLIANVVLLVVIGGVVGGIRYDDDELYRLVQERTFQYFYGGAEPNSKLACERINLDNEYPANDQHVVTSGGSGFGMMAILVGIERGFITRKQGFEHLNQSINWLETADRYHGAWPHWLDGNTGKTVPFGQKDDGGDLVETSFLVQGMLCVRQYFKDGTSEEQALAEKVDNLTKEVEWDWYRGPNEENVLFWHWSPIYEWAKNLKIRGWNECLITYVLAVSSPTHGVDASVYHEGWAENGEIMDRHEAYGHQLGLRHQSYTKCGPLFWSHFSFLGLHPRGLRDRYANYWNECVNHTLMNYDYCILNPQNYTGYGPNCWGLTASYSSDDNFLAHCPENDLGVIAPTAALSSFPYTPNESMAAMRHFHDDLGESLFNTYGFFDAFSQQKSYFKREYLAHNQGPIVVMMENHRTGLLWKLFMSCREVQEGLLQLEFEYATPELTLQTLEPTPMLTSAPTPASTPELTPPTSEPTPALSPELIPEPTPASTPETEQTSSKAKKQQGMLWNSITSSIFFIVLLYENVVVSN